MKKVPKILLTITREFNSKCCLAKYHKLGSDLTISFTLTKKSDLSSCCLSLSITRLLKTHGFP